MIDPATFDQPNETVSKSLLWSAITHLKPSDAMRAENGARLFVHSWPPNGQIAILAASHVEIIADGNTLLGVCLQVMDIPDADKVGPTYVDADELRAIHEYLRSGEDAELAHAGVQTRSGFAIYRPESRTIALKVGSIRRIVVSLRSDDLRVLRGVFLAGTKYCFGVEEWKEEAYRYREAQIEADTALGREERDAALAQLRKEREAEGSREEDINRRTEEATRRLGAEKTAEQRFIRLQKRLGASPAFTLVDSYAKRYGGRHGGKHLSALRDLLETKGFGFTIDQLTRLIDTRIEDQIRATSLPDPFHGLSDAERLERILLDEGTPPLQAILNRLDEMSGVEFEELAEDVFRRLGWRVSRTPASGDQGADLILARAEILVVVQAKRYRGSVGNKAVQEVTAARRYYGASGAMVVTTGRFTRQAEELARANDVQLVDRGSFETLLWQVF